MLHKASETRVLLHILALMHNCANAWESHCSLITCSCYIKSIPNNPSLWEHPWREREREREDRIRHDYHEQESYPDANKVREQLCNSHDSNIFHRKLRNQSFSLHQVPAISFNKLNRNQQNKQKNADTASQNKWSRACGRAMKAPTYPPTPENCNGLGDRRLRDAIRRLPIKSPEGSPATINTRSFSFLAPAAAPPPFPWQWDEKGALKWELKRQQGSKVEERAYLRREKFSQHLHIFSLSAKPKTRAQESWANRRDSSVVRFLCG